jgi:hypothetical protein
MTETTTGYCYQSTGVKVVTSTILISNAVA